MKITDMIISAILKKGIVYEARNADMEFDIPMGVTGENGQPLDKKITIRFKAEHVSITVDKE